MILGVSLIFDTGYSFVLKVLVVLGYRLSSSVKTGLKTRKLNKSIKQKEDLGSLIEALRAKLAKTTELAASTRLEVEISSLVLKQRSLELDLKSLGHTFNPLVSVIIPTHNGADVIGLTIKSVLANSYQNKEIIVIDDASADDTYKEAAKFKDQIQLIKREKSTGLKTGAVNFGLNFARADIISVIDDDTLLEPDTIVKLVKNFQDPRITAATANVRTRSERKNMLTSLQSIEYLDSMEIGRPFQNLLFKAPFVMSGCCSMFRKRVLSQIGAYDIDIITEDLDITWKLYRLRSRIAFAHEAICYTDVPADLKKLRRQRFRWEVGFFQTLYKQRSIAFNKKYGLVGLLLLPETIVVEFLLLFLKPAYFVFLLVLGFPIFTILLFTFLFYVVLQFSETLTAGLISSKKSLALKSLWAPVLVVYRQYLVLIRWKALYGLLRRKGVSW